MKRTILVLGVCLLIVGCTEEETGEVTGDVVRVDVRDADGNSLGFVTLRDVEGGVSLSGELEGLPPGPHGFHIHETGRCDAPSFSSAGGHFAPDGREHGFDDPGGPHAGDLRNLEVPDDRTRTVAATNARLTLRGGPNALLDADGAALVIHAGPDDYRSQPSGAAGDRIACGVIGS